MKKRFVCGFMFNPDGTKVVLILKERPTWQAGKLNGVGGSVNDGESELDAMIREFEEETGVHWTHWKHFATIHDKDDVVQFFKTTSVKYKDVKTMTDETVVIRKVDILNSYEEELIDSVRWLVPMALDPDHMMADAVTHDHVN